MSDFANEFKGKNILVTGGTGSIGSEIVRQVLKCEPKTVRVFARGEHAHHRFRQELGFDEKCARFIVGDIRDKNRLRLAMEDIDIIFHAAAMKHVDICDRDPFEAVKTNILGTQNVIELAREFNVEKVIAISTDKAANPQGVLGASKLMAEKLILNSYYYRGNRRTKCASVRFGNVLGSSGSILPLLKKQIKSQDHVAVTDPEMTRFIMTISQAVGLVLRAAAEIKDQEIFVLKMPAVRLEDLIGAAIEYYAPVFGKDPAAIKLKIIGPRPGEKKHEQLLAEHESENVIETDDMYILTPREVVWGYAYKSAYADKAAHPASQKFSSEHAKKLTKDEIKRLIEESDIHMV